jgi:hypothetical protein
MSMLSTNIAAKVTKFTTVIAMNLVTSIAATKLELLLNKLASVGKLWLI